MTNTLLLGAVAALAVALVSGALVARSLTRPLREKLTALESEQKISAEQRAQVEVLNRQVSALRDQLAAIQKALDISEKTAKEQKVQIADLGKKLNVATR